MEQSDTSLLATRLDQGIGELGLAVEAGQRKALLQFLFLLQRWNQAYNLTSVRSPIHMVERHLLDSLSLAPFLYGRRILDVGTGAGLPGIPLAVVNPALEFELLDSNGKKTRFVRQATLELGLKNVSVTQARIESYRPTENFDTIVSRAMASATLLAEPASRLVARPGRLLAMKGRDPHRELGKLARFGENLKIHQLRVPLLSEERHLIEIRYS